MSGYMREVEGFMDLVNRKCGEFMRNGGGPLSEEKPEWTGPRRRSTPEMKQAAIEMARTGKHTMIEISRATSVCKSTVVSLCQRRGILLPCGYKGLRADAYYAERDRRAAA